MHTQDRDCIGKTVGKTNPKLPRSYSRLNRVLPTCLPFRLDVLAPTKCSSRHELTVVTQARTQGLPRAAHTRCELPFAMHVLRTIRTRCVSFELLSTLSGKWSGHTVHTTSLLYNPLLLSLPLKSSVGSSYQQQRRRAADSTAIGLLGSHYRTRRFGFVSTYSMRATPLEPKVTQQETRRRASSSCYCDSCRSLEPRFLKNFLRRHGIRHFRTRETNTNRQGSRLSRRKRESQCKWRFRKE